MTAPQMMAACKPHEEGACRAYQCEHADTHEKNRHCAATSRCPACTPLPAEPEQDPPPRPSPRERIERESERPGYWQYPPSPERNAVMLAAAERVIEAADAREDALRAEVEDLRSCDAGHLSRIDGLETCVEVLPGKLETQQCQHCSGQSWLQIDTPNGRRCEQCYTPRTDSEEKRTKSFSPETRDYYAWKLARNLEGSLAQTQIELKRVSDAHSEGWGQECETLCAERNAERTRADAAEQENKALREEVERLTKHYSTLPVLYEATEIRCRELEAHNRELEAEVKVLRRNNENVGYWKSKLLPTEARVRELEAEAELRCPEFDRRGEEIERLKSEGKDKYAEYYNDTLKLVARVRELEAELQVKMQQIARLVGESYTPSVSAEEREYRERLDGYTRTGNNSLKEALALMNEVDEEVSRAKKAD